MSASSTLISDMCGLTNVPVVSRHPSCLACVRTGRIKILCTVVVVAGAVVAEKPTVRGREMWGDNSGAWGWGPISIDLWGSSPRELWDQRSDNAERVKSRQKSKGRG